MTKKELIKTIEEEAEKQVGKKFKTNPLNFFSSYKNRNKEDLQKILIWLQGGDLTI